LKERLALGADKKKTQGAGVKMKTLLRKPGNSQNVTLRCRKKWKNGAHSSGNWDGKKAEGKAMEAGEDSIPDGANGGVGGKVTHKARNWDADLNGKSFLLNNDESLYPKS